MNALDRLLSGPSAEQRELADSADRFLAENYSTAKRRHTIASGTGFDRQIWAAFSDMGWLALPFGEADGGLGGSAQDLAALIAPLGRAAVVGPFLDAIVLAGTLLQHCPAGLVRTELIESTIAGSGIATVALLDPHRRTYDAPTVMRASRVPGGVELNGQVSFVPFARQATAMLIPARHVDSSDAALSIYVVKAAEVQLRSFSTVDGGTAADVVIEALRIPDSRLLAGPRDATVALARAVRLATYCACVEAVAIMDHLIVCTADYLRSRKQFGKSLAQFQALQHMIADMTLTHARADAATWSAGAMLDSEDTNVRDRLLAAAKYEVGRAGRFIGQRAVHLHGGIGMTDEFAVGHYFKRLLGIDILYGGTLHQLQRFAALARGMQTEATSTCVTCAR